ncbi:hypothetical protein DMN91_009662 [Ooceraea biroi]|uniref:Steroid receptor RNA activator n=1 Tax=Ooceraea biroi TaxID=2015173 RepID=A0A026W2W4_OOCBI|nr:steroid receptor RNA activator 1 [Ooceraea biroi]EZA50420.1 Steroid receptor RNA activator [Ooceraea biroi]RLU17427.1 hypothetical protein DMN91_009662 [Ooceraea biroi]
MEQTPASDTVSSQKSLPSSQDPGWNDPPEWALSTRPSSAGRLSTTKKLNKRVPFPLTLSPQKSNSSKTPPVLQASAAATITSAPHKPLVTPVDKNLPTTMFQSDFNKDEALIEAFTNLGTVITERKMETNTAEEILRRLDVMKTDWLKDRLNESIQRSLLDLSKALLEKDVARADRIHFALVSQHAAVCRVWIPAIRHIIFEFQRDCKDFNISELEQSQSLLLNPEMQKK